MDCILAIDVGTQSLRACVIDPELIILAVVALYQELLSVAQGPQEQFVNLSTKDSLS